MNFVTLPHIHKSHDYYAKIMALESTNSVASYTPYPFPQTWDPGIVIKSDKFCVHM
jgi:hypothetical protein